MNDNTKEIKRYCIIIFIAMFIGAGISLLIVVGRGNTTIDKIITENKRLANTLIESQNTLGNIKSAIESSQGIVAEIAGTVKESESINNEIGTTTNNGLTEINLAIAAIESSIGIAKELGRLVDEITTLIQDSIY